MARCPFAEWRPIPENDTQTRMIPWGAVVHTGVTDARSLFGYWARDDVHIESTFYIDEDGGLEQYMDTEVVAHCQLDGNYFDGRGHVSIETWDGAGDVWDGRDVDDIPPWNDAQITTMARLFRWLNAEHGIPIRKIPAWNGRGIGYHAQFTDDDYPRWNESHACPGATRIAQLPKIIELAQEDDNMPLDRNDIEKIFTTDGIIPAPSNYPHKDQNEFWELQRYLRELADAVVYPQPFTKPYYPDDNKITEREATRWTHSRVKRGEGTWEKTLARTNAILDALQGLDTKAILTRIDERHAAARIEREALAERFIEIEVGLAQMRTLLEQHADGALDAAAVVEGIRELLHQATAPATLEEGDAA